MMNGDKSLNSIRQCWQAALNAHAFLGAEAVERLGHEIVANPQARQRALDSLDDGRRVAPDFIQGITDLKHLGVELPGMGNIAGAGRRTQLDVEPGEEVCAPRDTTVTSSEDSFRKQLFRPN